MFESCLNDLKKNEKYRLGIVLGGGGARGFAHLGVMKRLKELGIQPDIYSGVSAGALAGAFLASGKDPEMVMDQLEGQNLWRYSRVMWPRHGIFNLDGLKKLIQKQIPFSQLEDLPTPLVITTSNMNTGKAEYINKGNLPEAVLASSSIPFVFQPVQINGFKYADGGLLDNLPLRPIKELCEKTLVISITPLEETKELDNLIQIAVRTFQMSVSADIDRVREMADYFVEPDGLEEIEMFDFKKARMIFNLGYKAADQMDFNLLLQNKKAS